MVLVVKKVAVCYRSGQIRGSRLRGKSNRGGVVARHPGGGDAELAGECGPSLTLAASSGVFREARRVLVSETVSFATVSWP